MGTSTVKTVTTELTERQGERYLVALMPSESSPGVMYRTDVTNGRCSCPAWKFSKAGADGKRSPCKHLRALGFEPAHVVAVEPEPAADPKEKGPWFKYSAENL